MSLGTRGPGQGAEVTVSWSGEQVPPRGWASGEQQSAFKAMQWGSVGGVPAKRWQEPSLGDAGHRGGSRV